MKRLQLIYKNLKRLQLICKNLKSLKNKEEAMGCITDAMRITNALNHVAYWNYLRLSFITCPISPKL